MSLVDGDHLRPASRGRHGAHYKLMPVGGDKGAPLKMGMIMYRDVASDPYRPDEKMCDKCFWTAFSNETKNCWRCGSELK